MHSRLICPVRGCRLPLERGATNYACSSRHSFDIAKSGYINLLQPQERKSKNPGDTTEAVAARRRLHDRGVTRPIYDAISLILGSAPEDVVLDAGCGDGFYLGTLARETGIIGHGIDISLPAVDAAARRYPNCRWVVGNADRFIPYEDATFTAVASITARMNVPEFRRILREDGRLLIALAAPDDLIELRGHGRDRVERTVADFSGSFQLIKHERATTTAELDRSGIEDILLSIYRPMRSVPAAAAIVTFSLDLLLFQPVLLP